MKVYGLLASRVQFKGKIYEDKEITQYVTSFYGKQLFRYSLVSELEAMGSTNQQTNNI